MYLLLFVPLPHTSPISLPKTFPLCCYATCNPVLIIFLFPLSFLCPLKHLLPPMRPF